jgi:hypothetical protein
MLLAIYLNMKHLLQLILATSILLTSALAFAEDVIYEAGASNRYAAFNSNTGEQVGIVHLKANNQVTFFYGKDIRLNGSYQVFSRQEEDGDFLVDRITAQLVDNENTSIWVDRAEMEISLYGVTADNIKNPSGIRAEIKFRLDGSKRPQIIEALFRRL